DEQSIHDLIRRGFVQYVQPNLGAERKPGFEVAHTNRAVLVNEAGLPVATYLMTVPEDVVKLRRVIEGREEFPKPGPLLTTESTGENPDVQLNLLPAVEGDAEKSGASEPKAGGAGAAGDERAGAGGAGTAGGVDPGAGCESPEVDPEVDADGGQTQQSGVGEQSAESVGADPAAVAVTGETAS
ncbi:MAG: hypothetical protein ACKPJJ_05935, partial [Planctomycetaceae bacterium]